MFDYIRKLEWDGHVWRSQNPLLHKVTEEKPIEKRPLGRPHLKWEDIVGKNVKSLIGGPDWKARMANREN